jgi:predicted CopG family antitoxin
LFKNETICDKFPFDALGTPSASRSLYLGRTTITLRDKSDKKMTTESSGATRKGRRTQLRRIVVSEHNYFALKKLGYAGDSFNDVISRLLRIEKNYREMKKKQEEEEEQRQKNTDKNSYDDYIESEFIPPSNPSTMFAEQNNNNMQNIDELLRWVRGKKSRNSKNNQTKK